MVDGSPPIHASMARVAASPAEGRRIVAEIHAAGYDAVKTYSNLDFETFSAIVDEASNLGLRVVGHLPLRQAGRTAELLRDGFGLVAHLEEFAYQAEAVTEEDIPRLAHLALERGVWQITTLRLNERVVEMTNQAATTLEREELRYVHPLTRLQWQVHNRYAETSHLLPRREAVTKFNPTLLRAFLKAGVPLVVGTDTLVAGTIPGFGLHDELEALAQAGMPPQAILEAATRQPAEWLGVFEDRGSIVAGKRADLLLLDADPVLDISNTRRISAVIASGRVLWRNELDEKMAALATRYAAQSAALSKSAQAGHDSR
jgi:imidazolonepropionase-like amidohydrolase